MSAVATWLIGATILFMAAIAVDWLLARRRPLAASAIWNAVLVSTLALGPAVLLLPRWELAWLPAERSIARAVTAVEPIQVDRAGEIAAGESPRQREAVVLPSGRLEPSREPEAFAPVDVEAQTALWRNWKLDAAGVMGVIYAFGVSILLVRLVTNLVAVSRLRRKAQPLEATDWQLRHDHWRRHFASRRAVALLASHEVSVPMVLGWRRPAIVIPASLVGEHDSQTIDAILVHELAHVERADCGWQLIERLVQAIYWFHPFIWLASRRIRAVRERACDDFAIHALADRNAYAATLVEMAARLSRRQRLGLAMAVVRTTQLEQRLAAIETSEGSPRHRCGRAPRLSLTAAVILAMLLGVSVRLVAARQQAQPAADDSKSTEAEPSESAKSTAPSKDRTAATAKSDENITDFVRDEFPQQQKDLVKQFHALLASDQVDEAVKLFAPALQEQLPAADLKELMAAFTSQFSPLESRLALSSKRAGTQELLDVQSSWGRHRLSTAFHFNAANQIDGLWFSLDPRYKQFAPELTHITLKGKTYDLTADELVLGAELVELAKANKSLTVRFVDANGNAANARHTTFYRALGPSEAARPDEWRDTTTGTTWRYIRGESRVDGRAEKLAPGTYRAVSSSFGGFGYQLSDPIVIEDDQQDVAVDVPIRPTGTLTVKAVDATTGEPLPGCSVGLVANDPHIPSYSISGNYELSEATFKGLHPGRHRLSVTQAAKRLGELDYGESEQLVDVVAGDNAPVTVRLQGKPTAPAENERRWPYFASGRVTDGDGRPIEGAEISALIVYGTDRERGHVTSDADGRYRLQFGLGYVQAPHIELLATIRIAKPGFYDRDALTRKQLILLSRDRLPDNASGGAAYLMPKQTLEQNFVLLPGVDLQSEFVDAAGKPIASEEISLLAQLPAGPRHASGGKTSPQGELATEGLSPQQSYHWARIGNGVFPARSRPFRFSSPGQYRMRVQRRRPSPRTLPG